MNTLTRSIKIIKTFENYPNYFLGYLQTHFGFREKDTTYRFRNGIKLKTRGEYPPDRETIGTIFIDREYTPKNHLINKKDVVVDIGAHIGAFTVFASTVAKQVYSYEPFIDNFKMLEKNVSINLLKNVKIYNLGIAGKGGKKKLFISQTNTGHSFFGIDEPYVEVECITLKDIFVSNGIRKINFLKIDCEGAEYEILFNTSNKHLKQIEKISLEYHNKNSHNQDSLIRFLEDAGFKLTEKNKGIGYGMLYGKRISC